MCDGLCCRQVPPNQHEHLSAAAHVWWWHQIVGVDIRDF